MDLAGSLYLGDYQIFTNKLKIYCISGLGADKRVFRFFNPGSYQLDFLEWISPVKRESLEQYALRLAEKIDKDEEFILIGLSFGGMVAVEIAKAYPPKLLVLISSVLIEKELPLVCRMAANLRLSPQIPVTLFAIGKFLLFYLFGVKSQTEKKMLSSVMEDTDRLFLKWAIGAIFGWKNSVELNCLRIHGKKDKILPLSNLRRVDHTINRGGHLIILSNAKEVSALVGAALTGIQ